MVDVVFAGEPPPRLVVDHAETAAGRVEVDAVDAAAHDVLADFDLELVLDGDHPVAVERSPSMSHQRCRISRSSRRACSRWGFQRATSSVHMSSDSSSSASSEYSVVAFCGSRNRSSTLCTSEPNSVHTDDESSRRRTLA